MTQISDDDRDVRTMKRGAYPAEPDRSGFSAASGAAGGGSASGDASRTPG